MLKVIGTNESNQNLINNNIVDIDKILKCNLTLLACIIISLILMPTTDGLSVVIAGVFAVWLLVFVVINIIKVYI